MEHLEQGFRTYFDEMERCTKAKCYWALLHVIVVMPDICAALESETGDATEGFYKKWCKAHLGHGSLPPDERYAMRNALLHHGRTIPKKKGRYKSYSFVQPAPSGDRVHRWVTPEEGTLDVHSMADETKIAIRAWFADLLKAENAKRLRNVERHLPWLAREKPKSLQKGSMPPGHSTFTFSSTSTST